MNGAAENLVVQKLGDQNYKLICSDEQIRDGDVPSILPLELVPRNPFTQRGFPFRQIVSHDDGESYKHSICTWPVQVDAQFITNQEN